MTVSTQKKQEPMHAVKVTIQPRLLHPRLRLLVAEEEGLLLLSQVYRSLGQMSTRKSGRLRMKKGDPDAVDKINKQQLKVPRDVLKMYRE